jgi:diguanylate cyclase (GGDEF)-like protein
MAQVPGLWLFIVSAAILSGLLVYGVRNGGTILGRAFLFLITSAFIWTVAFILELSTLSLSGKLLFARIQFVGIVALPIAWLHLALVHTGRTLHRVLWSLILAVGVGTLVFVLFVPLPNLFWGSPSLVQLGKRFASMDYDYGPLFTLVLMPYTMILILISMGLLVNLLVRSHSVYRSQTLLILIGTLLPLSVNVLYLVGITPLQHVNYASATLSVTGLLFGYALFRYRYLDLYPLARDMIVEQLPDAVLVLNGNQVIIDANRMAKTLFPSTRELIGLDYSVFEKSFLEDTLLDVMVGTERKRADDPIPINGRLFDISKDQVEVTYGQGNYTVVMFHDVTEREELYQRIEELGRRDPLTGVLNRRELTSRIDEIARDAAKDGSPLSIFMLDIDGFKEVNDTYGHKAGDIALETFAKILYKGIQPTDFVGRYGGDEFVITAPDTAEEDVIALAQRIREEVVSRVLDVGSGSFRMKVSIGVVTFRFSKDFSSTDPSSKLLSEADAALYSAKREGKNRVVAIKCSL